MKGTAREENLMGPFIGVVGQAPTPDLRLPMSFVGTGGFISSRLMGYRTYSFLSAREDPYL